MPDAARSTVFEARGPTKVYRVRGGRAGPARVGIGRRNEDAAEVLEGLTPGDRLSDGVRVRVLPG